MICCSAGSTLAMSAHPTDVDAVPVRVTDLEGASRYFDGRVSTWTIRQWIADGLLPVFKPP